MAGLIEFVAKAVAAKPDTTADLLAALEEAGHALNRWGPAAGERYLRMVEEAKEGGAA